MMDDEMQAIADAEHGHAQFEQARVGSRRVGVVDRRRPAGENDAEGIAVPGFR